MPLGRARRPLLLHRTTVSTQVHCSGQRGLSWQLLSSLPVEDPDRVIPVEDEYHQESSQAKLGARGQLYLVPAVSLSWNKGSYWFLPLPEGEDACPGSWGGTLPFNALHIKKRSVKLLAQTTAINGKEGPVCHTRNKPMLGKEQPDRGRPCSFLSPLLLSPLHPPLYSHPYRVVSMSPASL